MATTVFDQCVKDIMSRDVISMHYDDRLLGIVSTMDISAEFVDNQPG